MSFDSKNQLSASVDLISFVAHQLKTPVAELKGFIDNMLAGLAGELSAKQREYLLMMQKISARNYQLVYNLLNVSRIEQGTLSFEIQPIELREVVDYAMTEYAHAADVKGLKFILEEKEKKVVILAALDKMIEALRNLIDNAIRFTDKGSVTIRIKKEDEYGVIEVEDTGGGISADLLPKLFTKAFMLAPSARPRGGFGLGLYIAHSFITMQKGKLEVRSKIGEGTTFVMKVPLYKRERIHEN